MLPRARMEGEGQTAQMERLSVPMFRSGAGGIDWEDVRVVALQPKHTAVDKHAPRYEVGHEPTPEQYLARKALGEKDVPPTPGTSSSSSSSFQLCTFSVRPEKTCLPSN